MPIQFMTSPKYLLTSESVTEGHPDKLCDQISDAVLDAALRGDPMSLCSCYMGTPNHYLCPVTAYFIIPPLIKEEP